MSKLNDEFEQNYYETNFYSNNAWLNSPKTAEQLFVFTKPYIGENNELGKKAFLDLLITIAETQPLPKAIVFWCTAVVACTEDSETLEILTNLEKLGILIMVSDNALFALKLKRKLRAGKPATYFELLDLINRTPKIINF